MKTILFNAMLAITMMMCSCEKFTSEEESSKPIPGENNVGLEISSKDQVKKVCKKVSFGFFKDDAKAGQEYELKTNLTNMDDTAILIYGASRIQALNDLSACYIHDNDFSKALHPYMF